jgi:AcrR family transcriptional regulator
MIEQGVNARPSSLYCWETIEMQDRRIRRTQNLLARALIALTLEKGYDAVTIRDITDRADVGYATFFRHYHDKDALLHDVTDVVLEELLALLGEQPPSTDPTMVGTLIFRYVGDHSEIIRALLGSGGSSGLMRRMIEASSQRVLRHHTARAGSVVPIEIAAHHLVAASVALIQWWLDHGMPYPPERMGAIYHELIVRPTSALAFES